MQKIFRAALAILATAVMASNAHATSIGAGIGILDLPNPNNTFDTPSDGTNDQSRINIDDTFTAMLGPGEYDVASWSFRAGQTGSVIPFLAFETAPDVYQFLVTGNQVDVDAGGLDSDTTVPFGDTGFTLDAETEVFAGILNPPAAGMQNPVYTNLNSGSTVDHDNNNNGGVQSALDTGVSQNFGHGNLARSYAFSIEVVPEPSSSLLVLTALAGLVAFKLRRRQ